MGTPFVSAAWTAGITIVVIFAAVVAGGFWILARRGRNRPAPDAIGDLQRRANILLVRVDDAVKGAEDELGYALAQFGQEKTRDFRNALDAAKLGLTEAFGLQQRLDDAVPDTATQRREWTARIIHLCEKSRDALAEQERRFAELRQLEKNAPESLAAVRTLIESIGGRAATASATLAELREHYTDTAIASVTDNVARAEEERQQAIAAADSAQARLDHTEAQTGPATANAGPSDDKAPADDAREVDVAEAATVAAGSATAADAIRSAEEHAHRALSLLDAVGTLQAELATASAAVTDLQEATRRNLAEARALRDAPPDADSSAAVAGAIETVEAALAAKDAHSDPLASLEVLRAANAELDSSLASARNQQRRLEGARTALVGALVGARSQLTTTRDFISTRRGGVGAEARTRLAEAERLLRIAEAESDPVAALDAARSSATYSRDADALARYDLMRR